MFYRSLNAYLRETFGCKVYKLALSAGCTCPNRDGTIGTRGCIFCSGSGEFAASASLSIPEQLAQAKRLVAAKAGPDARLFSGLYQYLCPGGGPAAAVCGRDPTAGGLRALHRHAAGLPAAGDLVAAG